MKEKRKVAVYDLDSTLLNKDTFMLFLKFLKKEKYLSSSTLYIFYLKFFLFLLKITTLKSIKNTVLSILKGKTRRDIEIITDKFVSEIDKKDFRPELLGKMEHEKKEGYELIMLTASPDIYTEKLGKSLGFTEIISTKTRFDDDIFTGEIDGENLDGNAKLRRLKQVLDLDQYDLVLSRGYGNMNDQSWLDLFGNSTIYK